MNITVTQGNLAEQSAAALVVSHFEGQTNPSGATKALDDKMGNAIRAL
ncbi:MAG: hypothetical protein HZC38_17245, partial [Chloroflexi bacterium]|nr:hypothetical protein [Chloroflexota bacterium]